jgi:Helix-turn-helix of DDE superfamily endonuclease
MPKGSTAGDTAIKPATKYDKIKGLSPTQFRRLTGVKPVIFDRMVVVLKRAERQTRKRGGKPKLIVEDRLLLALEYLRDYPTYFRLAQNYGVSESTAWYISRWVEDILIKDKQFALPGRKALLKSDMQYEVILVDASESPVERPKKDNASTTPARRNGTPKRLSLSTTS